ncbi:MAG: hypothetical protein GWO08_05705 [Gammaproteobacteria bacterium]|nr:hypothetical protein [Gammaproteobacteria bacterium]NIO62746.1 hypothetical protein [Gammaproteobacteria bacterium]NIQ19310.1 hypothetical protein [Gammaproteobacteria bacterium]NIQ75968.1 hypothetical protein [Gammaproteobacteria bacterium]NIR93173.1 hypothetical protein [Gammaproteobacteria bacterium]
MSYAIVMAVLLESSRLTGWRLHLSQKEFNHISDLSSLIFLMLIVYIFSTEYFEGIFTILSILPFLYFLLMLAQDYSTKGNISLSTLFVSLRKTTVSGKGYHINISYPYLFICILSSSAGNHHSVIYFVMMSILVSIVLFFMRPTNNNYALPFIILITSIVIAFPAHKGLRYLQSLSENRLLAWFEQFIQDRRDPNQVSTAIGSIGRIKQSDKISLRIDTGQKQLTKPLLLKEATYSNYGYGNWSNHKQKITNIEPGQNGTHWILNKKLGGDEHITIYYDMPDRKDMLPMPHGTIALRNLAATQVDFAEYGSVSVEYKPGWINYETILNSDQLINESTPTNQDLVIPEMYNEEIKNLAKNLGLFNLSDDEIINITKRFFSENFYYSLTQSQRYPRGRYLSKFLFDNRKGHCEFFATSTALLLRAAGIPTRYVIGYSIQEYNNMEKRYVVRSRHAHSWVIAWVNKQWQIVDTTPSIWAESESDEVSSFRIIYDIFSWLGFQASVLNTDDEEYYYTLLISLVIAIIFLYILNKLISRRVVVILRKKAANITGKSKDTIEPAILYKLFQKIEFRQTPRKTGQTLLSWSNSLQDTSLRGKLMDLVNIYYQYRFDTAGDKTEYRKEIEKTAKKILKGL